MSEPAAHPGPELAPVRMHVVRPDAPVLGTVVENRLCTASPKSAAFVRHIAIDVSGTPLEGAFRAGQSFGVSPPGHDPQGKPHKVRLYSLASPSAGEDGHGRIVATTVKRTLDELPETGRLCIGVASNFLCDLRPGDRVPLSGPSGKRFVLPSDPAAHDYVFVATGTGIAPFRGMVAELLASGVRSRVLLVAGAAYSTDLLYHQEFAALAAKHPNFTYHTAISRHHGPQGQPPAYVQDRLSAVGDQVRALLEGARGLVYLCGVAGMELGILRSLSDVLEPVALAQYLRVKPEAGPASAWDRRMIHREVAPTRRVFMEVY